MKISLLVRVSNACDYHRVSLPFKYLPLEDGEKCITLESDSKVKVSDLKSSNLVVCNRYPMMDIDIFKSYKKKYGFKFWVDIDDYWELYKDHYLYDSWRVFRTADRMKQAMEMADIVTVTNKRLLVKVREYNDKVVVIPNALPIGYEQFRGSSRTESSLVRFMYSGGPSHKKDLESIETFFSLASLDLSFKKSAAFIMAGYHPSYKTQALHDMNNIISRAPNYSTREGLSLPRYMNHYLEADISIAPLEDNEFNTYKSNLKVIEAGCMRMPIICSNIYPYKEDEEMSGNGITLCREDFSWLLSCQWFLDHPAQIIEQGRKLYDYVNEKYNLIIVNKLRRGIINSFK